MKIVLSESELREGVARLAEQIAAEYEGRLLTIVGVLTGSVVLLADLIRLLPGPLRVGLVQARSYRGTATRPGPLAIHPELFPDIRGHDVLLVDDIYDTGRTLLALLTQIDELDPASVRSAVLLRKLGRSEVAIEPDYVGFEIPNEFVVGYGLDYNDLYRNLPYLAALETAELGPEPSA